MAGIFHLKSRKTTIASDNNMEVTHKLQSNRLSITLPDIDDDLPSVWEVNQPLVIRSVILTEAHLPSQGKQLLLSLNEKGLFEGVSGLDGACIHQTVINRKGVHRLSLNHPPEGLVASLDVKIVDYREEIIRLFNNRFTEARERFQGIVDSYTARDLYEYLKQATPKSCHDPLREIVFIFEEANYSTHIVPRDRYSQFFRFIMKYKEALDEEDG